MVVTRTDTLTNTDRNWGTTHPLMCVLDAIVPSAESPLTKAVCLYVGATCGFHYDGEIVIDRKYLWTITDMFQDSLDTQRAKDVLERSLGRYYRLNFDGYHPLTTRAKRRERKSLSASKSLEVFARNDYRCVRCGSRSDLTVDHIIPVSRGGTNDDDNLQTLCRPCNSRKGAR